MKEIEKMLTAVVAGLVLYKVVLISRYAKDC